MGKTASEGKALLSIPEGVFYNPEMELCRDICSLCVMAIGGKPSLLDAMCATGVRGIRYKKENKLGPLTLVDMSKKAVLCARKNAKKNKVKCKCIKADAKRFLLENRFDFVEIDPFGSPVPYLHYAAHSFRAKKKGYLSVTATDMAVLCGAHHSACLKNYCSIPLDNEFCHENAVRILAAKVIQEFSPFNLSAKPIFTLSHRHYVKIIFEISKGSEKAVLSVKSLSFLGYCTKCCFREAKRLPKARDCPYCGNSLLFAGPLYTGPLWDSKIIGKMLQENVKRHYKKKKEIEKLLSTMLSESKINSYAYYDLHVLAKKMKKPIKRIDDVLENLRKAGFLATRTHFCATAIRTDAPHEEVIETVIG